MGSLQYLVVTQFDKQKWKNQLCMMTKWQWQNFTVHVLCDYAYHFVIMHAQSWFLANCVKWPGHAKSPIYIQKQAGFTMKWRTTDQLYFHSKNKYLFFFSYLHRWLWPMGLPLMAEPHAGMKNGISSQSCHAWSCQHFYSVVIKP